MGERAGRRRKEEGIGGIDKIKELPREAKKKTGFVRFHSTRILPPVIKKQKQK